MIEIEKPKIEIVEISEDNRYGKFVCEPLERGYGTTLGNSLRRILLSSLEGAAITSIKIDGVLHEFSTIPGVRDDVTNIILNLKELCLKMHDEEPHTIRIDVTGEKEVTRESERNEKDPLCVSWEHLPQPHGRVRDEGLGEESGAVFTVPYRIGGYQPGGDRQPGLSSGAAQAGSARDLLRRPRGAATHQSGLRQVRPADRHGQREPAEYVPHLRRRLCRQDVPPDGPHCPPRQCGRPVVHRGLRVDLAGCAGGLPGIAERIVAGVR